MKDSSRQPRSHLNVQRTQYCERKVPQRPLTQTYRDRTAAIYWGGVGCGTGHFLSKAVHLADKRVQCNSWVSINALQRTSRNAKLPLRCTIIYRAEQTRVSLML